MFADDGAQFITLGKSKKDAPSLFILFAAPPIGIYAVFPQRKHLPLRVRLFIDLLKNTYGNRDYWAKSA